MYVKVAALAVVLIAADSAHHSYAAVPQQPAAMLADAASTSPHVIDVPAHADGSAMLLLTHDRRGRTVDLRIERTSGSQDLDRAALVAARRWRFKPESAPGSAGGTIRVLVLLTKR